jgi:hypothetical protein
MVDWKAFVMQQWWNILTYYFSMPDGTEGKQKKTSGNYRIHIIWF